MQKDNDRSYHLSLAEQVYEQMNGFYVRPLVPGVRDESRDGVLTPYLDALYDARGCAGAAAWPRRTPTWRPC